VGVQEHVTRSRGQGPQQLPQDPAPNDAVFRGHHAVEQRERVRQSLQQGRAQEQVLGNRVRGLDEFDCQAAGGGGYHLPQHLQGRQGPGLGRRRQGLVLEFRQHARLRQSAVHRADASLPDDPLGSRGRQCVGAHHSLGGISPVRSVSVLLRRPERPGRTVARAGQSGGAGVAGEATLSDRRQSERRHAQGIHLEYVEERPGRAWLRTRRSQENRPEILLPEGVCPKTLAGRSIVQSKSP